MMTKSQCEQESNTHSEHIHTSTSLNQTGSETSGSWSMVAEKSVLFNLLSLKRFAAPVELCSAKSVTSIWPDSQLAHVYVCAIMLPYSCWSPKDPKTDAIALKTCHKILATVRHSGYWVETLFMTGNERESQCTNWFLHLFYYCHSHSKDFMVSGPRTKCIFRSDTIFPTSFHNHHWLLVLFFWVYNCFLQYHFC